MTLIARLEAATGPDRELDVAIHCELNPGRIIHPKLPSGYTMSDLGNPQRNLGLAQSEYISSKRGPCMPYTASLDAALTLVPDGWSWRVQNNGLAALCAPDEDLADYEKGAIPAIALCIACLRARQEVGT